MIKNFKQSLQKITKKIFQTIFIIFYGNIKNSLKPQESNKIKVYKVNKGNHIYNVFTIEDGRLYTDTINDLAVILNNQILDGPSYQLRPINEDELSPRNNSTIEKNIVFSKGTPRIKKKIKGSVISLLSGGGANKNYFHWLYDVLPKLSLFDEIKEKQFIDYLLVPDNKLHFQKESLKLLGFNDIQILSSRIYRHIVPEKIYLTDHTYNITNNPKVDHERIPAWISEWLKKKFLNKINLIKNKYDKIYIDRGNPDIPNNINRRIINEIELKTELSKRDFKFIKLQETSFLDQINIFNNAKVILGLHGAGFANISFCKPNTRIVELRTIGAGKVIENLASNNNLDYNCMALKSQGLEDKQNGLVRISISDIKKLI